MKRSSVARQADELRRAMGHRRKLPRLQAALKRLRDRCVAMGVAEAAADEIVEDLHSFANYGFPESHAWSFALIAYATAFLKAHYPAEFFLGLLNAWPMGFYPPATLVHDARRHGVTVLPPCLRVGEWECTIEGEGRTIHRRGAEGAEIRIEDKTSFPSHQFEVEIEIENESNPYLSALCASAVSSFFSPGGGFAARGSVGCSIIDAAGPSV